MIDRARLDRAIRRYISDGHYIDIGDELDFDHVDEAARGIAKAYSDDGLSRRESVAIELAVRAAMILLYFGALAVTGAPRYDR